MDERESFETVYANMVKYRDRLRRRLLDDVFNAQCLKGNDLEEIGEYYAFQFVSSEFVVLVYNFIDTLPNTVAYRKRQAMGRARELLEQSLLPDYPEGVLCDTNDLLLCLLNLEPGTPPDRYLEGFGRTFRDLLEDPLLRTFHCVLGVGFPCDNIFKLRESYDSAVNATHYGVLRGYNKWYQAQPGTDSYLKSVPISSRSLAALQTALLGRNEPMLREWVREVFEESQPLFQQDPASAYLLPRIITQKAYAMAGSMIGALELAHAGDRFASCVSVEEEKRALEEVFHRFCVADKTGLSPAVVQVRNYLREHYVENIPLENLARIASLNPQYLSVVFRKETGQTISEYIRQLRMNTAQELLTSTTMSVADVAYAVGYQDGRYFSRIFHQEFRQTPRQYRAGSGKGAAQTG